MDHLIVLPILTPKLVVVCYHVTNLCMPCSATPQVQSDIVNVESICATRLKEYLKFMYHRPGCSKKKPKRVQLASYTVKAKTYRDSKVCLELAARVGTSSILRSIHLPEFFRVTLSSFCFPFLSVANFRHKCGS